MKREDLISVKKILEKELDKSQEAYFGVYYLEDYSSTFIKANKKGVVKFTKELLNILLDFDFHLSKEDHYATIKFKKGEWFDKKAPINLGWVEPLDKTRIEILEENENYFKSTKKWYHKPLEFIVNVLIKVFILIGFIQTIIWLFKLIF
ncbi:hypothetical protein [Polaribacter aestuariivivens]|uniref:hypothetical protein n=1 Tax=Polaribacter aestuariivivens TaxID=2304626 RepID=UPI003F49A010